MAENELKFHSPMTIRGQDRSKNDGMPLLQSCKATGITDSGSECNMEEERSHVHFDKNKNSSLTIIMTA